MKKFTLQPNESPEDFFKRVQRGRVDMIIDQIDKIADHMSEHEIIRIIKDLDTLVLEVIVEECEALEKYEVCQIARNLIEERQEDKS